MTQDDKVGGSHIETMPQRDPYKNKVYRTQYFAYQNRYRDEPRESDKVLLRILEHLVATHFQGQSVSCLDIGCSTGNLLFHLKGKFPQVDFTGGDMLDSAVEQCRTDAELAGIHFEVMDLLHLQMENRFDLVIANAVMYRFDAEGFQRALDNVWRALKPGGWVILFDHYHHYPQEVQIVEHFHGDEVTGVWHMRSYAAVKQAMVHSFECLEFHPFAIPIDLTVKDEDRSDGTRHAALVSHTVRTDTGDRLIFRGCIYQPFCHVTARKSHENGRLESEGTV